LRYSPINAPTKGQAIIPIGPKKIPTMVPIIHPTFPRLVPQNCLVQIKGKR
jgi:hypothetical protein